MYESRRPEAYERIRSAEYDGNSENISKQIPRSHRHPATDENPKGGASDDCDNIDEGADTRKDRKLHCLGNVIRVPFADIASGP